MATGDATNNQFSDSNPQVINHDSIPAGNSAAGGDTPRIFPRQNLSGNSRGIQQFGSPNLFADSGNNFFGVSKNSVQQVLMGNQPTFGEGFYVTKDGVDVAQTTSPEDFIFNSNQNVFKIVFSSDIISIPSSGGNDSTVTLPHGLDFTPAIIAYATLAGIFGICPSLSIDNTGLVNSIISVEVDATNVYVSAYYPGSTVPAGNAAKYYLLQETAN